MADSRHYCNVDLVGYVADPLVESPGDTSKYQTNVYSEPPGSAGGQALVFKVSGPKEWWVVAPGTTDPKIGEGDLIGVKGAAFKTASGVQRVTATEIRFIGQQ